MVGVEPVEVAAAPVGHLLERDPAVIVAVGAVEAALLAGARVGGGRPAGRHRDDRRRRPRRGRVGDRIVVAWATPFQMKKPPPPAARPSRPRQGIAACALPFPGAANMIHRKANISIKFIYNGLISGEPMADHAQHPRRRSLRFPGVRRAFEIAPRKHRQHAERPKRARPASARPSARRGERAAVVAARRLCRARSTSAQRAPGRARPEAGPPSSGR